MERGIIGERARQKSQRNAKDANRRCWRTLGLVACGTGTMLAGGRENAGRPNVHGARCEPSGRPSAELTTAERENTTLGKPASGVQQTDASPNSAFDPAKRVRFRFSLLKPDMIRRRMGVWPQRPSPQAFQVRDQSVCRVDSGGRARQSRTADAPSPPTNQLPAAAVGSVESTVRRVPTTFPAR